MGRITIQLADRKIVIAAIRVVPGFYLTNNENYYSNIQQLRLNHNKGLFQLHKVKDYCFLSSKLTDNGSAILIVIHQSLDINELCHKIDNDESYKILRDSRSLFIKFTNIARVIASVEPNQLEKVNADMGGYIEITELIN